MASSHSTTRQNLNFPVSGLTQTITFKKSEKIRVRGENGEAGFRRRNGHVASLFSRGENGEAIFRGRKRWPRFASIMNVRRCYGFDGENLLFHSRRDGLASHVSIEHALATRTQIARLIFLSGN